MAKDAPDVPFLPLNFNNEEYQKWELVRKNPQDYPNYAPFGTALGEDPNDPSKQIMLPIAGPPALDQIWPIDTIGNEWKNMPENREEGLLEAQRKNIETDQIRKVEFIRLLGKGSWGMVFESTAETLIPATGKWLRLQYACKVIRHEEATWSAIEASFGDYIALRYLRHKNICNLADIAGVPDPVTNFPYAIVCLFLEYCNGDLNNLYAEAQNQQIGKQYRTGESSRWILPVNLSRHWFAQIARALNYIHSNGVAHQDMKLANILYLYVDPISDSYEDRFLSSNFKLTDFGNAFTQVTFRSDSDLRGHMSRFNSDINWLYHLWYSTGIPAPKLSFKEPLEFAKKCKENEFIPNVLDQWIDEDMYDLIGKLGTPKDRLNASQIMVHPWILKNTEPRTELYIERPKLPVQTELQY